MAETGQQRFTITLTGTEGLIMHNARLSNPLDSVAKAIKQVSGKRIKTEGDYEEMARLEHMGGLYHEQGVGPYIPGQNIERALLNGAKITRSGKKIERGVFITSNNNPLIYRGPHDIDGLWKDVAFRHTASVRVTTSRVTRTRPIFRKWEVKAEGSFDPSVISLEDLAQIATIAGQMEGLGDWRPRFGRFTAVVKGQ